MQLNIDNTLLEAVLGGTLRGLEMTTIAPTPVGASRLARAGHEMSVIVGLAGKTNGSLSINLSRRAMLMIAGGLLGEPQADLNDDNLDAIMEVGNMVAGSIKEALAKSDFHVSEISLPSLVFGRDFSVVWARGITTAAVEFEINEMPVLHMHDRFFTTSISLLRGSGR